MGNFIDVKLLNFHTIPFTPSLTPPNLNPHYNYLDDIGKLKRMFDAYLLQKITNAQRYIDTVLNTKFYRYVTSTFFAFGFCISPPRIKALELSNSVVLFR